MPSDIYAVVASVARFWFLFLIVIIVRRSYSWLRKDGLARRKRVRSLPDAGYIGELMLITGESNGVSFLVPREGVIGSLRICDVVVTEEGVAGKHAAFYYQRDVGLFVEPYYKESVFVDGEPCVRRGKPLLMLHGSQLKIGSAVLRMCFFVGIKTHSVKTIPSLVEDDEQLIEETSFGNESASAEPGVGGKLFTFPVADYVDPFDETEFTDLSAEETESLFFTDVESAEPLCAVQPNEDPKPLRQDGTEGGSSIDG